MDLFNTRRAPNSQVISVCIDEMAEELKGEINYEEIYSEASRLYFDYVAKDSMRNIVWSKLFSMSLVKDASVKELHRKECDECRYIKTMRDFDDLSDEDIIDLKVKAAREYDVLNIIILLIIEHYLVYMLINLAYGKSNIEIDHSKLSLTFCGFTFRHKVYYSIWDRGDLSEYFDIVTKE